ncbi:TRAP transporter large permease [Microbacterium sp. G2-8]|uniref:TRAP transporter large permease n=1 Tax=Microbacterium sp. G2-8 TaxID=2842454 RepID=UPI001C8AC943|nr:TRAP transporter large permease [Microbacterium sp. G2-8]
MSTELAVIVVIMMLIVLLASRMPVWLALGASGIVGMLLLRDVDFVTASIASVPFEQTSTFSLTIIPMFILMGIFAVKANIAEQVFTIARSVFHRVPGGLGISTVVACAGFAAVSGSSIGTAATMSKLAVGEMRKAGYPTSLAGALVAMAGTLGAMIPPSVFLVLYAILTGESIAAMLAAGIIPGLLSTVAYSIYILVRTRRLATAPAEERGLAETLDAVAAPEGTGAATATSTRGPGSPGAGDARPGRLPYRGLVRLAILFAIIMGGIYTGLFTPTESAAIGALAAAVMLLWEFRRAGSRQMMTQFVDALKETAQTTSMVFAIIVGSAVLSLFFVVARVPNMLTDSLTALDIPDWAVLALLLALLIPLGMMLESISIMVIAVPLIYPIANDFGFDGIWLGILVVKLIEIGMVTPPVGINCFVVAGTAKVRASDVFRGVWPFVAIEAVLIVVLFLLPDIVLWLPSLAAS